MSIIKCPECGKEISDKADVCIGCGFPIKKELNNCKFVFHGENIDTSEIDDLISYGATAGAAGTLMKMTGCDFKEAKIAIDQYIADGSFKSESDTPINRVKCPTCHSANVERISGTAKLAGALTFGLFSNTARSQFKCKNCGYKW